jgi:hypothetical protein
VREFYEKDSGEHKEKGDWFTKGAALMSVAAACAGYSITQMWELEPKETRENFKITQITLKDLENALSYTQFNKNQLIMIGDGLADIKLDIAYSLRITKRTEIYRV